MADIALDTGTGELKIERYCVSGDVGRAINPMIVEGQLVGGVVQGIGGALLEELAYDEDGNLQTGSFADYLLPSSHEVPHIEALVVEKAKSLSNDLGVKGCGEIGISGVAAVLANAIAHALGTGARPTKLPLTAERLLDLVEPGS